MITLNLPRDIISTSILHQRAAQQATQGPDVTPAYMYVHGPHGHTTTIIFHRYTQVREKYYILNALFIHMLQNLQPAVTICKNLE